MEQDTTVVTAPINNKPKAEKSFKVIAIVASILAILGISFGFYEMMQKSEKDNGVGELNSEVNSSDDTTIPSSTNSQDEKMTVQRKNPVLDSVSNLTIRYHFTSEETQIISDGANTSGSFYVLNFGLSKGKVTYCSVDEVIHGDDFLRQYKKYKDCEITGLSGNIYKPIKIGEGQDGLYEAIGFIMEDGSVEYISQYEAFKKMEFKIDGKLKIDGFVTDAFAVDVTGEVEVEVGGGFVTTVFVLNDGSVVKYDRDTMF